MKILESPRGLPAKHTVLMLGLGMLGSSIRNSLQASQYSVAKSINFDWADPSSWDKALQEVAEYCHSFPADHLSISWSAGAQGFRCTEEEALEQNRPFLAVLNFVTELREAFPLVRTDFHYMSSAGGLFEGQRIVGALSEPAPVRPYGHLKLLQEVLLKRQFGEDDLHIYRPSTVYGPMQQKTHQGLINNLVNNGLRGRTTVLDSQVMSLRDYVFFADIGRFVARRIRNPDTDSSTSSINFLVSARCSSIFEVVHTIERVLRIKLNFRYDEFFGNHSDITFSEVVLPNGWRPTPLDVGIRQFVAGKHAALPVRPRSLAG